MLIDIFINAIFLYDDKIVLTYNCKDGAKTISLRGNKWFGFGLLRCAIYRAGNP